MTGAMTEIRAGCSESTRKEPVLRQKRDLVGRCGEESMGQGVREDFLENIIWYHGAKALVSESLGLNLISDNY